MRHVLLGLVVLLALARTSAPEAPPVCGNGLIEPPETCDDGNLVALDGCSPLCQIEIPNLPPDCRDAEPTVASLWPPNHRVVDVGILGVVDPDDDPVAITVLGVAQDEPVDDTGDGHTCPDAVGVGGPSAGVRAERSGRGDGRVYHVAFAADDGRGGTCTGEVDVCVPHDQGRGAACVDQGALYDATAGGVPPCDDGECEPEDCVPPRHDVLPPACARDGMPERCERRLARARVLLARAAGKKGRAARRLAAKAEKQLRRATESLERGRHRDGVSEPCRDALRVRFERAGECAACAGG
jgi:cysteine-rich repeat protein